MRAVFKREFRAYFQSPLGYVFIAVLYFFTAYYFFTYNLYSNTTDMSNLFTQLFSVVLFMVPILTMRLMSEDKRARTDQLLLTAPVSRLGIVLGKYLSALCVYLLAMSASLLMAVILSFYAAPDWPVIIGNLLGMALLGACLIAVCGFAASLVLILVDALVYVVSTPAFRTLFSYMSFNNRYNGFTYGIIDFSNVLFFVSIAVMFLLLTTAVLEKRRWS